MTRMYIHSSRRMVLANAPPFTCLLVTTNTSVNHSKQTDNKSEKGGANDDAMQAVHAKILITRTIAIRCLPPFIADG